ncbi:hypothetical protein HYDPIDRAFT_101058 [Hydnomerulius pinastri MD-312]|uniref:Unplaced genomic scaffold scaffold_59, whole genome shotgun sequence n=1 Tax=Hydnomerulius pinastri MD-312 TaxID=994086 RepID=A0A0C9W0A1_9AGAM|nr:hypothetical protein HYDPIDRAFT_101058 [Hydnomerulius pinastri MD-312]
MGLFACAPVVPSLAVDLRVLELIKTLFIWITPNTTVWSEALEEFLNRRGYYLKTKDSLRCRFSNAYHWYCVLVIQNTEDIAQLIRSTCDTGIQPPDRTLQQPSDYLHERCPACFGRSNWRKEQIPVDCVVCIDACFTQKSSKNPRRREQGQRIARTTADKDVVKVGMKVPISVLEECGGSFIATDKKREKASTQFFSNTRLMVLLCRHDCVLWLANMTSAGKKQHYALALIEKLHQTKPSPSM